jgi:UDP-2,3-diacylglucosamine hydrolase
VLIHGHTHRPDTHDLGNGLQRWVLSDWDCSAQPPRAEVLRLQLAAAGAAALQRIALPCA